MSETGWKLGLALVLLLIAVVAGVAYHFGVQAGEETAMTPPGCFFCGDPLGEHAVIVLPNEKTPFSKPIEVCAKCYRQAIGVDKPGEKP